MIPADLFSPKGSGPGCSGVTNRSYTGSVYWGQVQGLHRAVVPRPKQKPPAARFAGVVSGQSNLMHGSSRLMPKPQTNEWLHVLR